MLIVKMVLLSQCTVLWNMPLRSEWGSCTEELEAAMGWMGGGTGGLVTGQGLEEIPGQKTGEAEDKMQLALSRDL